MADETKTAFDPSGKKFVERVDAFIQDVKATHNIVVTKDSGRTAAWQQKHHVAHMFVYNKYQSVTPSHTAHGERTIAWDHFSDPNVKWASVDSADFLRTKSGSAPTKTGADWTKGDEPDKDATLKQAKSLLISANIGNSGEAMVSAGLSPCGEPCGCGAGRSNHLSDNAADLNSTALTQLTETLAKLEGEKATDVDKYLAQFGLHRPLLNHATSPEKWHVESK